MPSYRAYLIDPVTKLVAQRKEVEAADDLEASNKARQLVNGHYVELWDQDRYIGWFTGQSGS